MIDQGQMHQYAPPGWKRATTIDEARRNGRHCIQLYGGVLDRYPQTAIFNTSDIRVLLGVIEDLTYRGRNGH